MVVPNNHGNFPTKNDHFGCEMGETHHLRKPPIYHFCKYFVPFEQLVGEDSFPEKFHDAGGWYV